jgi:sugar phosphate permease
MTAGRGAGIAWLIWGLGSLAYFVALFHRMSLGVASLDAQARFGVQAPELAAFSVLQLLVYLAMQVPAGVLADRLGPRTVIAAGMALMGAGELLFGSSTSLAAGLLGRGLVGLGDACIFLNALRLAHSWFPAARYGMMAMLTGMAGGLGQLLTTAPLSFALRHLGWTGTFATSGIATIAFAVLLFLVVRDRPPGAEAPGEGASVEAPERVRTALREAWARRGTRLAFWTHFTLMGPFITFTALWGVPFLVQGEQFSTPEASWMLTVTVLVFVIASIVSGRLVALHPSVRPGLLAATAFVVTIVWAIALAWPGRLPAVLLGCLLVVTGIGGANSLLGFELARADNPSRRSGSASGLVNIGGFGFAAVVELVAGGILSLTGANYRLALLPVLALAAFGSGQLVYRLWSPRAPVAATELD